MLSNKHVASSLEKQQLQNVRKYYLSIADINSTLSKVGAIGETLVRTFIPIAVQAGTGIYT